MIREQFWRGNAERRGDQDEKRQPYQNMIAPSPHRRKPLPMVPPCDCRGAAISFRRIGRRQRTFIGLRGWARRPVVGVPAAGIVQRSDLTLRANSGSEVFSKISLEIRPVYG